MDNVFKNVMNAAANSTSNFVKKMYESEKENSSKDIDGFYFETTITILDKDNNPVMVSRSTVSDAHNNLNTSAPEVKPIVKADEVAYKATEIPAVKAENLANEIELDKNETVNNDVKIGEVASVKSVPVSNMLNSNIAQRDAQKQNEIKTEPATAENNSSKTEEPVAPKVSGETAKKQKIEELLKKYSSLD